MDFTRTQAPLPKAVRTGGGKGRTGKSKYDFASMQIGDSDLTVDFIEPKKAISRIVSAVAAYKKRSGDNRRFIVRVYKDDELNQDVLGVWCLAPKAKKDDAAAVTAVADEATEQAEDEYVEETEEENV